MNDNVTVADDGGPSAMTQLSLTAKLTLTVGGPEITLVLLAITIVVLARATWVTAVLRANMMKMCGGVVLVGLFCLE
ncbi:hypothetical protein Hamer_G016258 [Homarus americanus]|uniref:Transmembrane protein n=1 Tax=Homarus americanus TaxID=6706 RepID=A0A8J5JNU6_HOMAM|nr:hypothetical protein Hamer_G016258 [Homarus americanus]